MYLVVEQLDGKFLDEHGLTDGNLYEMAGGTGTLTNQGPTQPSDNSDLANFMTAYGQTQTDAWWREQLQSGKLLRLPRHYRGRSQRGRRLRQQLFLLSQPAHQPVVDPSRGTST